MAFAPSIFRAQDSQTGRMRRRDYIVYAIGSLFGVFCGLLLFVVGSYLWPPRKPLKQKMRVEGWIPVAHAREVPPESSRQFVYGNIPGVIMNDRGELRAYSLICSHLGCVINWLPDMKVFSCPCHGGEFNSSGAAIGRPPEDPLNQFSVRIREKKIYVRPAWDI